MAKHFSLTSRWGDLAARTQRGYDCMLRRSRFHPCYDTQMALGAQLTFNANLRLFTSSKSCIALSRPANTLYAVLLILCYTSTSLFSVSRPPPEFCETHAGLAYSPPCGNDVHVSPPALYCLGFGLIGQCFLVGFQYVSVKISI
jgi:hypothetical protein